MQQNAKELIKQGDKLFSGRSSLMNLWQDSAEQFYPERADFTRQMTMGDKWVDNLTSSQPIITRRELGNQFSAMLRPRGVDWMEMFVDEYEDLDSEALMWLEDRTERQKRAMYDHVSGFVQSTKQTDHDYVTFGQGVLKVERNYRDYALLVRNRHLRDVVWTDDYTGKTDTVHEKWKPTAWDLSQTFARNKLHKNVIKALDKEPDRVFECRHVVIPASKYGEKSKLPFISVYVDVENDHVIEQAGSETLKFVIPRWQTVAGSQYSFSQAALAALPTARLLQAVTLTILEAGEKYANPPMLAVEKALRGDMNLFAGGVTYVDDKYDERLGEVLRPLTQDKGGFQAGIEILDRVRQELNQCFFLDKLSITQTNKDMTAFEVSQIISEHVRNNLPLFEPVEHNYNAPLCEMIFTEMMGMGFMGKPEEIPQSLRGRDLKFKFMSPLQGANDRLISEKLVQSIGIVGQVAQFDPSAASMINTRKALRESLRGIGDPEDWLKTDSEMDEIAEAAAEKQKTAEMLAMAGQGAAIAETAGKAGIAMKEASE